MGGVRKTRFSARQPPHSAMAVALLGLLALLAARQGAAAGLLLAQSGDAAAYRETRKALLDGLSPRWQVHEIDAGQTAERSTGPTTEQITGDATGDIAAAIGSDACTELHRALPDIPLLCLLLPRANFARMLAGVSASAARSALYIDQPGLRQLRVASHLFPSLRRFAVLHDAAVTPPLLGAAPPGVELLAQPLALGDNLIFTLRDALREVDALLAIPDKRIYNRRTLRSALLTAYRARKPLIGYAKPFVKAGALMSLYTQPAALGREAAGLLEDWLRGAPLAAPGYPRHYAIAINPGIARALALAIDAEAYRDRLYAAEELP